ncbi:Adenylate cyclase 1 (ATP pyrophosphate-lyase 1) (Adenylyl cyclase 1) [Durusdinium trenchii]|uniref:Adenylate cyclase 1 (ATP pyrophosphate-lyase 1) (Adenylyl cyclase 1) n=1 Tax=Durusdinium trenchii TaxID=1381693 RepID=A0ABP0RMK9_9DINO
MWCGKDKGMKEEEEGQEGHGQGSPGDVEEQLEAAEQEVDASSAALAESNRDVVVPNLQRTIELKEADYASNNKNLVAASQRRLLKAATAAGFTSSSTTGNATTAGASSVALQPIALSSEIEALLFDIDELDAERQGPSVKNGGASGDSSSGTLAGSSRKRRRQLQGTGELNNADTLQPRTSCGFHLMWKYRTFVLVSVVLLQTVTILGLVLPSALAVRNTYDTLNSNCLAVSDRQLELSSDAILGVSRSLGSVGGGSLMQHLVSEALAHPTHAVNAVLLSLSYARQSFSEPWLLGTYGNDRVAPGSELNVTLWEQSMTGIASSFLLSNTMQTTSKIFAVFDSQYLDVQFSRSNNGTVTAGATAVLFRDGGVGSPEFSGSSFAVTNLSTGIPEVSRFNLNNKYILDSEQSLYEALSFERNPRKGEWSTASEFVDVFTNTSHFGYAFTWPWFDCQGSSADLADCFQGALGGVISMFELDRYCDFLINLLMMSLRPVEQWLDEGILVNVTNPENGLRSIQVRLTEDLVPPNSLAQEDFANLTNQTIAFLVSANDNLERGILVANSGATGSSLEAAPDSGFFGAVEPVMATQSSDPRVSRIAIKLESLYGTIVKSNTNYTQGTSTLINFEDDTICAGFTIEDHSKCLLVTTTMVGTPEVAMFQASNELNFLAVSVLPYVFMSGNLTSEVLKTRQTFTGFEQQASDELNQTILAEVVLAIVLFIVSVVLAFVLSIMVSRPLERLNKSMLRLQDLDFRDTDRYHSRIYEVNNVQATFSALRSTLRTVERFLPRTVVRQILLDQNDMRNLHVESRQVTIFFSDLQGFTSIAEALEPNELLRLLTSYLTVMSRVIESYEGTVGEIQGDGILAFWNTPDRVAEHAAKACASALAQQQALQEINASLAPILDQHGLEPLSLRIGIHTGSVLTGNIGSTSKMKFGCVGDAINLASRLEGICKLYGTSIICSADTFSCLPPGTFLCRKLDLVTVKGKTQPTTLYEVVAVERSFTQYRLARVLGSKAGKPITLPGHGKLEASNVVRVVSEFLPSGPVADARRQAIDTYSRSLDLYIRGDFKLAHEELCADGAQDQDPASRHLLLCIDEALRKHGPQVPPEAGWTGVTSLHEKNF